MLDNDNKQQMDRVVPFSLSARGGICSVLSERGGWGGVEKLGFTWHCRRMHGSPGLCHLKELLYVLPSWVQPRQEEKRPGVSVLSLSGTELCMSCKPRLATWQCFLPYNTHISAWHTITLNLLRLNALTSQTIFSDRKPYTTLLAKIYKIIVLFLFNQIWEHHI